MMTRKRFLRVVGAGGLVLFRARAMTDDHSDALQGVLAG